MIFGRPLQVTARPMLRDLCPVCLSVKLVYCGQMVGWIKMPLDMEAGLGPGDIVLNGDPAAPPTERSTAALLPTFRPMSIVAKQSPILVNLQSNDVKWLLKIPPHLKCVATLPCENICSRNRRAQELREQIAKQDSNCDARFIH